MLLVPPLDQQRPPRHQILLHTALESVFPAEPRVNHDLAHLIRSQRPQKLGVDNGHRRIRGDVGRQQPNDVPQQGYPRNDGISGEMPRQCRMIARDGERARRPRLR